MKHLLVFATCGITCAISAAEISANGCYAQWDDTTLVVSNQFFSREYRVSGEALAGTSWRIAGAELVDRSRALKLAGKLSVAAEPAPKSAVGAAGLKLSVGTSGRHRTLWLFPQVPGVLIEDPKAVKIPADYAPPSAKTGRYGLDFGALRRVLLPGEDYLPLAPAHMLVTAFHLQDMTDNHTELVSREEWMLRECRAISAPVVAIDDLASGRGIAYLRLAPLPHTRTVKTPDFCIGDRLDRHNIPWIAAVPNGFAHFELGYAGGRAGRIAALVAAQRALRTYRSDRDGLLLANTWGDCNRDQRLNEEFLLREIAAGAELGVEVVQIDDGWEQGITFNSSLASARHPGAHRNYRQIDPDFWQPNPRRFPRGLTPIAAAARERGMTLGLWFSPEVANECADWEQDAATMMEYWRTLGVRYFKIDQLEMDSPVALANQQKMFDRMLAESLGEMTFDLDVTGCVRRPGYFGMPEVGPIFVENRYWNIASYWPHLTLRAAWSLAEVMDPVKLRMEFCNPEHCNRGYTNSPLAPRLWKGDTLFATVMCFSPLAWCEVSELSPATVAEMKPLVAIWKHERANLHGGVTIPIGKRPDGFSWTGFATRGADGHSGYVLAFRELAPASEFEFDLSEAFGSEQYVRTETLAGRGTCTQRGSRIHLRIPEKLDFLWVKLSIAK